MLVLNVTSSQRTMESMIKLLGELAPKGNTYQLFQTVEAFGGYFKPPPVLRALLDATWSRAGCEECKVDAIERS